MSIHKNNINCVLISRLTSTLRGALKRLVTRVADCLQKNTLSKKIACAQRVMRHLTGYYSGYICKRQPIGAFELKQAALNLRHLAHKISEKSNPQQYHHVANRMLGDLECRGRTSFRANTSSRSGSTGELS